MSSKLNFLDIDSSICEKNYLIANDPKEDEISKLFPMPASFNQLPPKIIKPSPGFCVKSRDIKTDNKIFINICQTVAIPAPKDITEKELSEILNTDEIVDFRVPMSIGDLRNEPDKTGTEAAVCDIAINTSFFEKIQNSETFRQFLLAVAFEGFKDKHKIDMNNDRIILKNKKAMGTLQMHRIQQREIDQKMGRPETLPSVDEILRKDVMKSKIEVISHKDTTEPKYRLFKKLDDLNNLYIEVYLPYVQSSKDVTIDIGEDRVILECFKYHYFLDVFHEYLIDQSKTTCFFNKDTKFLTVTMPIKGQGKILKQ